MARAVLVWSGSDRKALAELRETQQNVIGRAPGSDILLEDRTISRRHATVGLEEGVFVLQNVSETNVAKVNGVPIQRPVPLSDRDTIELGALELKFYDLQSGDRVSGPQCSHCSRENMPADRDCWFCGTSLVNAPTAILEPRRTLCRVIAAVDGETYDVHKGEAFVLPQDGRARVVRNDELPAEIIAGIKPADSKGSAILFGQDDSSSVNGEPAASGHSLSTGDDFHTGGSSFLVIVR